MAAPWESEGSVDKDSWYIKRSIRFWVRALGVNFSKIETRPRVSSTASPTATLARRVSRNWLCFRFTPFVFVDDAFSSSLESKAAKEMREACSWKSNARLKRSLLTQQRWEEEALVRSRRSVLRTSGSSRGSGSFLLRLSSIRFVSRPSPYHSCSLRSIVFVITPSLPNSTSHYLVLSRCCYVSLVFERERVRPRIVKRDDSS